MRVGLGGHVGGLGLMGLLGLVALLVVGGCASRTVATARTTPPPPPPVNLATSLVTAQGTWAIAEMGGSAADEENFWQLFVRPSGAGSWRLATPPGVADNGGLIAAGGTGSLLAGFGISQGLAFSPLATSSDAGVNWAPGLIGAGDALDIDPDALSIGPGGHELAVQDDGTVDQSADGGTWTKLTSVTALAASTAGRGCGLTGINAVSFSAGSAGSDGSAGSAGSAGGGSSGSGGSAGRGGDGTPLVAGGCSRVGVVGIFGDADGTWQAAGPTLPDGYADDTVQVVRLVSTPTGDAALLRAGTSLLIAWATGSHWTKPVALPSTAGSPTAGTAEASATGAAGAPTAPALSQAAAEPLASGFGANGSAWVLLGGGHAEVIDGPGGTWQALPPVPAGTVVLVPAVPAGTAGAAGKAGTGKAGTTGSAGTDGTEALVVADKVLTVWRLDAGTWTKAQVINVPIQAGSSG